MNSSRIPRRDLGKRFFFNRSYDYIEPLCASRVEYKKRKPAIAGDETQFWLGSGHDSSLAFSTQPST